MWTALLFLLLWNADVLSQHGEKALVLLFIRTDCPISNRYAPDIQRLYQEFSSKGIEFRLVYPEPGLTASAMEEHRREYGYSIPGIVDTNHYYTDRAGANITPEAVVFVQGRLVYRGRVDDRYVEIGKERPHALHHDLQEILTAIVAGEAITYHETPAVGCAIEK
jgi:Redoxin